MKFKYTADKKSLVTKYENQILSEYKKYIEGTEIIKAFYSLCIKYDCGVKIGLCWINEIRNEYSKSRLLIEKGYCCLVCFELQKDGSILCVRSHDGETDYYPVSASWVITTASKSPFGKKLCVELFSESISEECQNDLQNLLNLLQEADENDVFIL